MYLTKVNRIRRVGFVSTRFKGFDGVSLETAKWAAVLERMGFECFYYCGQSDRPPERTMVAEEAYFGHPEVAALQAKCFGRTSRDEWITGEVHRLRQVLKKSLYAFIESFKLDLLVVENALAIPMHIPLGLAITEVLAETGMPAIGHHHDFSWERQRFIMSGVDDYLDMAFPPRIHAMNHVVINTEARTQLGHRRGLSSIVIPNVHDFSAEPRGVDDYNRTLKADLGMAEGDLLFLQPTRVIARKGIEHAIELAGRLKDRRVKLLVSHQERDEGSDYFRRILDYAGMLGVDLVAGGSLLGTSRGLTAEGKKVYDLWDCYANADLVTYPSTFEGFGNAFLEAVFCRKPLMVNRYSIFESDIEPIGFQAALIDNYVTDDTVRHVRRLLDEPELREATVARNFELGKKYFSYELLEQRLKYVIMNFGAAS
ncbi:MAG TPA: glycosyltransferase family 4 protein [Spirochaetia bacterium]|nr:glycosyltransferase family 4 protein [Spirochaetales bacterium]HRY73723.1 glycosyltransferase family 4 protein [Spirochaetia bacterium]